MKHRLFWSILACMVAGPVLASALPPLPPHPNGQALWRIVHDRCVPGQAQHGDPAPCTTVSIADGVDRGYVVLKDNAGATQYLVMPTRLITGVEDPQLMRADAVNYFVPAWEARHLVEALLGRTLPRESVSIAINSAYGRTQDLLHLHIDCLRADVREALRQDAPALGDHWSRRTVPLGGHAYHVIRVHTGDLATTAPLQDLFRQLHVPAGRHAAWSIVVSGATFADGTEGFYMMAVEADPAAGENASGEALQDHACSGS
jgi:CDP-diacylglycerol pyrophosphatase